MGQRTARAYGTKVYNAQVVIAKAINYWGDGTKTFAQFCEGSIADGTFSVFVNSTKVSQAVSALAADTEVFLAVRRGGKVHTSNPFSLATHKVTKTAYAAAQLGVKTVVTAGSVTVGKEYGILIKDLTTQNQASEVTFRHSVVAKTGDTLTTIATKLRDKINSTAVKENMGKDIIVTAALADTDNITITAKAVGTVFSVGLFGLAYEDWSVTNTTAPKFGQGTPVQIADIEAEGWIFEGVTTNQPGSANPEDFGKPVSLVVSDGTYVQYLFEGFIEKAGKGPINREVDKASILLAADVQGLDTANVSNELVTIFGV